MKGKAEYKHVMVTMAANIIPGTDEDALPPHWRCFSDNIGILIRRDSIA